MDTVPNNYNESQIIDMNSLELEQLAADCKQHLDLLKPLSDEYYYGHLGCCVMDAVHSISVKYESTRQIPIRYCAAYGLERSRPHGAALPDVQRQEPLSILIDRIESLGPERFANEVVKNRHRTSATNGILKTEAVLRFARCLTKHDIQTFQDLNNFENRPELEAAIKKIPGQKSGISLLYFWMLAGDDQGVKPDRMILEFLRGFTQRTWLPDQAVEVVRQLCDHSTLSEFRLTPRKLDHAIWNWQRRQG